MRIHEEMMGMRDGEGIPDTSRAVILYSHSSRAISNSSTVMSLTSFPSTTRFERGAHVQR